MRDLVDEYESGKPWRDDGPTLRQSAARRETAQDDSMNDAIKLDDRARHAIATYALLRDQLTRAGDGKENLRLREECRSYAAEFAFAVLALNPALGQSEVQR